MKFFALLMLLLAVSGCVTLEQVRTSRHIIKLDNDLEDALRDQDSSTDSDNLIRGFNNLKDLGNEALGAARALKDGDDLLEAISYYRIAATAYWQSRTSVGDNAVNGVVDEGKLVCARFGDKKPDRDCFFMELIVPFSGFEQILRKARTNGNSVIGGAIGYNGLDEAEKSKMIAAQRNLQALKTNIEASYSIATNFPGVPDNIQVYYCENTGAMAAEYVGVAGEFKTVMQDFWTHSPGDSFEIDLDKAIKLTKAVCVPKAYQDACPNPLPREQPTCEPS